MPALACGLKSWTRTTFSRTSILEHSCHLGGQQSVHAEELLAVLNVRGRNQVAGHAAQFSGSFAGPEISGACRGNSGFGRVISASTVVAWLSGKINSTPWCSMPGDRCSNICDA